MSISGVGSPHSNLLNPNSQVQGAQNTTPPTANDGTSGAFYAELNFNPSTGSVLGLRSPANADDADALLAEVSLLLEKTSGKSRSDRDAGTAQDLIGAFSHLLMNNAAIKALVDTSIALGNQLTAQQKQLATDQGQLATDSQTLGTAKAALVAAQAGGDPKAIAQAQAAVNAAQSAVNTDNNN